MASKSRNSTARAFMIRPAQSLFFEKGAVCVAECANSEAWVADCINFLRLSSIKNQQGAGFPDRLDQPNLALFTRRMNSHEIDTSNHFFFELLKPTVAQPWRRAPRAPRTTPPQAAKSDRRPHASLRRPSILALAS